MSRRFWILIIAVVGILAIVGAFFYNDYMREDNCKRLVESRITARGTLYLYTHKEGPTTEFKTKNKAIELCEQLWKFDKGLSPE